MARTRGSKRKSPAKRQSSKMTAPEAAKLLQMTQGGLYNAIKRGDVPTQRVDGRHVLKRKDVMAFKRFRDEWMNRPPKDPNRPLTDDEFLQALWDSDPD